MPSATTPTMIGITPARCRDDLRLGADAHVQLAVALGVHATDRGEQRPDLSPLDGPAGGMREDLPDHRPAVTACEM
jgi:hypothetical protein